MAQIAHDGSNTQKLNDILEAAQKRFGIYGLDKTAMHEIANDLGISKASLYYYFPDKESLYKAVIEKETDLFLDDISAQMALTNHPAEQLRIYSNARTDHMRTLLNLTRMRLHDKSHILKAFEESRLLFRQKEQGKIIHIIQRGCAQGVFECRDAETLADFFLDTIRGIGIVYKKNKDLTYFNDEDFARLKEQITLFVDIFIKGISK